MEELIIEPNVSIGTLKLGMSKEEIENCIESYNNRYLKDHHSKNHFTNMFRVDYDSEDKAIFIEIPRDLREDFICTLKGIDIFRTKVEELIPKLSSISEYDKENPELGYSYTFPKLGVGFWRPVMLSTEDIEKDEFKELPTDIQKDELKHLYFETVSIFVSEYYTR